VTLNVPAPDFTLGASPSSRSVSRHHRQSASYAITVNLVGGFNQSVAFSVQGVPSGATFTLTPPTSSSGTTLVVQASQSTPRGTYTITVTGASGSLTHSVSVRLTVNR
jgi:hypothetical protein